MWWLLSVPALVALAFTCVNLFVWPRGFVADRSTRAPRRCARVAIGRVSIAIPARDEERGIEACIRAAVATEPHEVLVYDDASTDDTPAILARLRAELPTLRVVPSTSLPAGWLGKPHACARLAEAAQGDSLLFVDADVVLAPDALERLASVASGACTSGTIPDVVTAVPRQVMATMVERLVLPFLHVTYLAWLLVPLIWRTDDPRFIAANGQLLWMRRDALARMGGHAAVRGDVVDDVALCRRAKTVGLRVVFADGDRWARCRMYRSGADVAAGFAKNIAAGVGSVPGTLAVMLLYAWAFVAPAVALAALAAAGGPVAPAVAGVLAALALRLVLVVRCSHPLISAVLSPFGAILVLAIATRSLVWHVRGTVHWKGRTYARPPRLRSTS